MQMKLSRALCATSALATGVLLATGAFAQSTTGSSTVEELVVTGASGPRSMDGILEQTAPKTRTTIDQEFIAKGMAGQAFTESLNVVPGYNFTNNDPYGNSGGNIRLRSFDGPRISFQWDGMQLNDSGNYAIFTNQVADSEIIFTADVAQGSTDVDAPSASATGGSINYRTRLPGRELGGIVDGSVGRYSYGRGFLLLDTGEIGPWGTRSFGSVSYTKYNKWRGTGDLEKKQFNARIYQPIGDNGDFASVGFHWNANRNNFYRNMTLADYQNFGPRFENDQQCIRQTPVGGTAQNETTGNTIVDWTGTTITGRSCTNYFNTRINPSNTGNIRGQFKYHLMDNLILTVDPNFQYVLANGGGFTVVSETDNRLRGAGVVTSATNTATGGTGKDLNGDGDTLDNVQLYTPNNTNTRRYGVNASLIWEIAPDHRLRLAYAYDDAHHRQTGEFTFADAQGNPVNVFGGKQGHGPRVLTADGTSFLRGRDRFSIARLNMFAAEYVGRFMEDAVELRAGLRVPYFKRELNQFCYSAVAPFSTTPLCTTAQAITTVGTTTLTNGNVFVRGQGMTQYIAPYRLTKKYDKALPNVGVSYKFGDGHSVYGSFAQGLSAPRTDNLYSVTRSATGAIVTPGVEPETTKTFDVGYRYSSGSLLVQVAAYDTKFKNQIVSSFDPDLGIFIDRNIGDVDVKGFDAGIVANPIEVLTYTGNISYNDSEVQSNTPVSGGNFLATKGKRRSETPEWSWFQRLQWEPTETISLGLQAKYVGKRFTTDVNDQQVKAYTKVDLDARFRLPVWGGDAAYVQANITNLFNEKYIGSISSTSNAITVPGSNGLSPFLTPASPRAYQLTLHVEF